MSDPVASVLTPTYQHSAYIEACLRSVCEQTFQDWEVIVVDDGSTDGTPELARSLRDPRIRVIEIPHRGLPGLSAAYGQALRASRGALVAILEGDDVWPSNKLERQVRTMRDGVVLSYGRAMLVDDRGRWFATYARHPSGPIGLNRPVGSILPALAEGNFIVASTVLIKRSALERIGGFWQPGGIPFVDHPTWLRLAIEGPFAWEDAVVGGWRRHIRQYTSSRLALGIPPTERYLVELADIVSARGIDGAIVDRIRRIACEEPARQQRRLELDRARLALLGGDRRLATAAFVRSVDPRRPATIASAGAGILSALGHRDAEWFFRRAGRLSWPSPRD